VGDKPIDIKSNSSVYHRPMLHATSSSSHLPIKITTVTLGDENHPNQSSYKDSVATLSRLNLCTQTFASEEPVLTFYSDEFTTRQLRQFWYSFLSRFVRLPSSNAACNILVLSLAYQDYYCYAGR
ncbi:unnamed protein product, partial [Dicrocoelium dendriticum]